MKEICNQLINGLFPYLKYVIYIVIIVGAIICMFLLGRYIYRKIKNKKTKWLVFFSFYLDQ